MADAEVETLLATARARLVEAGARTERLGEPAPQRRLLGFARAPRIRPVGEAWHLGVLLLRVDAQGGDGLAATGEILRARTEATRGVTAESQRRRAGLSAAARRGGFAEGETVHLGWRPLAVGRSEASAPLVATPQGTAVRWSPAAAPMPLAQYLDEQVGLLVDPPIGAN